MYRLLVVFTLALAVASCDGPLCDPTDPGCDDGAQDSLAKLLFKATFDAGAPAEVVITVTAADFDNPLVWNLPVVSDTASGTLEVPTGGGRTIDVSAFDAYGVMTHQADTTVTIEAETNPTLELQLLPLVGDQPVVVIISGLTVEILPADTTLQVGDTVRFTAIVRDVDGNPLSESVVWGTTNPSVISVDADGLATARYGGAAGMVAVVSGVAGQANVIVEGSGLLWTPMYVPTEWSLTSVWGSSAADIFAVGRRGTIVHYNGVEWQTQESGVAELQDNVLSDVAGLSATDVWAVGNRVILRYDGAGGWSDEYDGSRHIFGVWPIATDDVFAVGAFGTILHYDGNSWTSQESGTTEWLRAVWGSSPNDVFAVGDGLGGSATILHYDGVEWTSQISGTTEYLQGLWGSGPSDVWATGNGGVILHYDGATWTQAPSGTGAGLQEIWGISASNIYVAIADGSVLHYDGASWTVQATGTTQLLGGVWASSPSDWYVVGGWPQSNLDACPPCNALVLHGTTP